MGQGVGAEGAGPTSRAAGYKTPRHPRRGGQPMGPVHSSGLQTMRPTLEQSRSESAVGRSESMAPFRWLHSAPGSIPPRGRPSPPTLEQPGPCPDSRPPGPAEPHPGAPTWSRPCTDSPGQAGRQPTHPPWSGPGRAVASAGRPPPGQPIGEPKFKEARARTHHPPWSSSTAQHLAAHTAPCPNPPWSTGSPGG